MNPRKPRIVTVTTSRGEAVESFSSFGFATVTLERRGNVSLHYLAAFLSPSLQVLDHVECETREEAREAARHLARVHGPCLGEGSLGDTHRWTHVLRPTQCSRCGLLRTPT